MTLPSSTVSLSYTGNGSTDTFPYTAKVWDEAEVQVYVDGVLQVSGYTVTGVGEDGGGNVEFTVAPANLAEIVIQLTIAYTQTTDLANSTSFRLTTIEDRLDKLTRQAQVLDSRTIKLPAGEHPVAGAKTLPSVADRAGMTLGFDDDGLLSVGGTNAALNAISDLTPAADKVPYFTSSTTAALASLTSTGRSIIASVDEVDFRSRVTMNGIFSGMDASDAISFDIAGTSLGVLFPDAGTMTVAGSDINNTFSVAQTFRAASGVRSEAAATQDAVVLAGRAGGTSSYAVSITPTTLSGNRTATLPDANIVLAGSASALTTGRVPYSTTGGLLTDNASVLNNGSSVFTIGYSTASSSTSTGALVVTGGVGVGGAGYFGGVVTVPNGTAAAPGIKITGEQTGLYRGSSTALGFAAAGVSVGTWETTATGSRLVLNSATATGADNTMMCGGRTLTATSATYGVDLRPVWAPTATSSSQSQGFLMRYDINATAGDVTASVVNPNAAHYVQAVIAAGNVNAMAGFTAAIFNLGAGTLSNGIGMHVRTPTNSGGGAITNSYGVKIEAHNIGTNRYGIDIDAVSGGSTNFAIRTSTGLCGFADSGVFGATALLASERLRVAGGTMGTPGATDVLVAAGRVYAGDTGSTSIRTAGGITVAGDAAISGLVTLSRVSPAGSAAITAAGTTTLAAGITDSYASAFTMSPDYTGAFTVTRHNYFSLASPSLAGGAAVTDACVFRFPTAAGTHKAVDGSSTKTTPGGVDAWVKININGTIYYMPAYTSKTA